MVEKLKNPEYTGENRCIPCTILNTVLGLFLAGLVGGVSLVIAPPFVAAGVSVFAFVGSLVSIWLRGYLVPGTPELTKRYMPLWMLSWFNKDPSFVLPDSESEPVDGEQLESLLRHEGILTQCDNEDDLCLANQFLVDWEAELEAIDDAIDAQRAVTMLGFDVEAGSIERHDDAVLIENEESTLGKWPSEAALRADMASASVLSREEIWDSLSPVRRAEVCRAIRLFLDTCPDGNPTTMKEQTVESCCSAYDVAVVVCGGNSDRLLEQPIHE